MKLGFWTLFGLAVAMRLALVWQTSFAPTIRPIPAYNDEPAHFNYVRYVAVHRALPVQQSSVQEGVEKGEYEYYQAPLYYLLAWPIYIMGQTLTPGGELSWVRSISALFSLGGILVLYLAVRRFFEQEIIALPVLLLGALSAIPTRFGSLVTNDSLFFALACLNFALLLEILHQGCDGRLWVAGILVSAAGLWTKASFLLLLPLIFF